MIKKLLSLILFIGMICFNVNGQNKSADNEFKSNIIKIAIVANDLDETLDFYKNVIGMTKVREFEVDKTTGKRFGLTDSISFKVTGLKLYDTPDATELKIMSFDKKPEFKKVDYIHDKIGVQYLTIYVNSMKPFIERIEKEKIELLGETPASTGENMLFVLIQDPNGVFIELIGEK